MSRVLPYHEVTVLTCNSQTKEFEFDESEKEKVKEALLDWIKNEVRPQSVLVSLFRHYIDNGELKVSRSIAIRKQFSRAPAFQFLLVVDVTSDTEEAFERFRKIKDAKPHKLTSFAEVDALYASVYAPEHARGAIWKAIVNQTSHDQPRHYYSTELSQALENLSQNEMRYILLFSCSQLIYSFQQRSLRLRDDTHVH